jgi:L-lactate dehydrogenase
MTSKIAIIGVGEVGAAAAFALLLESVCGELLLVDVKVDFRDGQVRDLSDATYRKISRTHVRAATHKEAGQCDIVVITTGSRHTIGETRLSSVYRSAANLRSVIHAMKPFRSDTILLVVSNPVDILTSFAQEVSGLPQSQVMGSGTFLDTVRLRGLLANKAGISASSIDTYVLGEQGDSQFVAWSVSTIGGVPIDEAIPASTLNRIALAEECKQEGQRIIKAKGAIAFGIGSIVSSICATILYDKRNICPISHFQPHLGCCLSLPVVLGRRGIIRTLSLPLNSEERITLLKSAKSLKADVDRMRDDVLRDGVV